MPASMRRSQIRAEDCRLTAYEELLNQEDLPGCEAALLELARRVYIGEQALHNAMRDLVEAETRLNSLQLEKPPDQLPSWLHRARARQQIAIDNLERLFRQIAKTPGNTKIGFNIRVQLIAALYGRSGNEDENTDDIILSLLSSLLRDLRRR